MWGGTEAAEAGSEQPGRHSAFPGLRDLGHRGASLSLSADNKVPGEANHCPSGSLSFTGMGQLGGWMCPL